MFKINYAANQIRRQIMPLMFIALILPGAMTATAQSRENGANSPSTATTRNAADDLRDCAQMLDQSIEETRAAEIKTAALAAEIAAARAAESKNAGIIASQETTIEAQRKTIARLTAVKCSVDSWFFGLRKKKTCY